MLASEYPEQIAGVTFITCDWLVALWRIHLGYHIGQIDYHRRLVTGDDDGGPVPVKDRWLAER